MQADEDEDEDDLITPREAEAIRNAELNKVVEAITSAATTTTTNTISNAKDMPTELNMMEPLTGDNIDMPTVSPPSAPQQQHMAPHTTSLRQRKRDKVIFRLTSFLRRFGTPKKQPQRQQQKGSIQTMWATSPIGDILDAQQQKEIMHMLQTDGSPKDGHPTPNEDATKVAKLDFIWVFRSADDSTLWTGFDYRNQIKLSKHSGDDEGIEVYDTHIRQGQLPILVIPKRKVCFYAPSDVSDQVASLQVACLPNSKSTQFVYRCGPMP
ncbi:hypothetical protein [Absidia glauca]|uniref:Uncharacterized protein n=1 Tax=Absidia glauca TaxID=4829 RepID=A0A168PZ67_ABSGL|nr:hypothetical protein [Absidia glauca]